MNEFGSELTVSQFLIEFSIAMVLVAALAALWREWLRRSPGAAGSDLHLLDQYETAWLAGGRQGAVELATKSLIRSGALGVDRDDPQRVYLCDFPDASHPAEMAVMEAVTRYGSLRMEQVAHAVKDLKAPESLVRDGLVAPPRKRWLSILPALFVVPAIVYVGVLEAVQLIVTEEPVTLVLLATVIGAYLAARLCLPAPRTRRGDAVLARLQQSAPRRDLITTLLAIRVSTPAQQAA